MVVGALLSEKSIQKNYWDDFNGFRKENGLIPLTQSKDTIIENWNDILPEHNFTKWKWILTNEEIATSSTFTFDSSSIPYHSSKTIYYETQLLFWKNFYGGEIDAFINPVGSDTTIELTLVYHSKNLNPGNFFYANIDTNYTNKPDILVCGTHLRNEKSDQVPIGNITKMQADKILKQWGIR